jgi:hypothetical protein
MKTQETKPFYLTTEFWGHAVLQFLLWVGALPTEGMPAWGKTAISATALIGYGLSRGLAKSGSPFNVDALLSAVLHNNTAPDELPQVGTTDIPPQLPSVDGSGTAGAKPAPQAPAAAAQAEQLVEAGVTDLAKLADQIRHAASEHPEVINQLKSEGVL